MFWVMILLVIFVGTPMLMFSLASLATEIGIVPVVVGGFVLLVASSVCSLAATLSMMISGGIVWAVYRLLNKTSPTPNQ